MKCLFCKRVMKDGVFHICPSRVPSMGKMGMPRKKKYSKQDNIACTCIPDKDMLQTDINCPTHGEAAQATKRKKVK